MRLLEENMASCNGMASSPFFSPNFILQMQTPHEEDPSNHQHQTTIMPLNPLLPCSDPQDLSRGMVAMVGKRSVSFSAGNMEGFEGDQDNELSDDCSLPGEKKRRLNMEQVRTLEKNFELGNKLEPERKMQLARALRLQPRQIAIWFQNRRARWKTKQLEKDYDLLKRQFDAIKAENGVLHSQNKKLQAEMMVLKGKEAPDHLINLNKETEGSCSYRSENSSEINLDISKTSTAAAAMNSINNVVDDQSNPFIQSIRQPPPVISQLLQMNSSSRHDSLHLISKIEQPGVADENLSNLLCGMEDQAAFWPWPDHNNYH